MNILVTGGAGYIGSHLVRELINEHEVTVYDNLEKGHKEAISKNVKLIKGYLENLIQLKTLFKTNKFDAVMHLASNIQVGESVANPLKYYGDVSNGRNLLIAMLENNVKKIIFSSSAAVYGQPKNIPIKETEETNPINPYGEYKLIFENMLRSCDRAHNLKYTILRYFNAAGADHSGEIGEDHNPETHLIPLILKAALNDKEINIYGTDYDTKDRTCIRDYIHVSDLVQAHILALNSLNNKSKIYNLSNGKGYSVREIIETARDITGINIRTREVKRREGDPAILIADSTKIKRALNWQPKYDIESIIKTAWNWHKNNPKGYQE